MDVLVDGWMYTAMHVCGRMYGWMNIVRCVIAHKCNPWEDKPHMRNRFKFYEALLAGERPAFLLSMSANLRRLLSDCWAHVPKDRPSFDEVVVRLKDC